MRPRTHLTVALVSLLVVVGVALAARSSRSSAVAAPDRVSLSGEWRYMPFDGHFDFSTADQDDGEWPTMRLPSNWFLKGNKEYPVAIDVDPAPRGEIGDWGDYGKPQPERGLDHSGYVWFRRRFQHPGAGPGRHAILRFEMVDYLADVYLNGHLVGRHTGYFQPFEFDVSQWLRAGENVLAVRVGAPALQYDWHESYPVSWPKRQAFVKGIFAYHDTRPGGTTDRGQERSTGGIIGDVSLRWSQGVDIVRAEVAPLDVSEERATLRIDYVLRNWTNREQGGDLSGEIAPRNFTDSRRDRFTEKLRLKPGETRVRITRQIERPALWWSWDYGKPNLYQLTTQLQNGLEGEHQTAFGIRSIRRDAHWVWYLNGKRIFPRGSNYISTQWLSQADRAWYERDVKMMIDANLNSIRVHAHVERPDFYEVADERGLMVWQDFPLQWGYTDLPVFRQEATTQLRDMVGLYFNHPSIIVWCMQNEAPHAMEWMKRTIKEQNLALDEALLAESAGLDPTRVQHRDSGTGDGHPYPGWYGGKAADFARLPGAPFVTEYGAQALPELATLKTMVPAAALWPDTEEDWKIWTFHNFQREQTFNLAKIPMGKRIEDFIANSQNYQGALTKFATEQYRRAKWTKMTGLYHFMFVENWPSVTWAVVDYYRKPKRGWYSLRQAMQPVLPSIEYKIDNPADPLAVWVVNDRHEAYPQARVRWRLGGQEQSQVVDVPADSVVKVRTIGDGRAVAAGRDRLEVWLEDMAGTPLGRNSLEAADFIQWQQ